MATTASANPGFLADWRRSLPLRLRGLVLPYGRALGIFVAGYAGATTLFEPWALGRWWGFGVLVAAGFGVCWGLWLTLIGSAFVVFLLCVMSLRPAGERADD